MTEEKIMKLFKKYYDPYFLKEELPDIKSKIRFLTFLSSIKKFDEKEEAIIENLIKTFNDYEFPYPGNFWYDDFAIKRGVLVEGGKYQIVHEHYNEEWVKSVFFPSVHSHEKLGLPNLEISKKFLSLCKKNKVVFCLKIIKIF